MNVRDTGLKNAKHINLRESPNESVLSKLKVTKMAVIPQLLKRIP